MEINISEKEYCKLEVHYEADKDQIDSKKLEVLSLFKKAPVPGFRENKANIEVIKIHYKKQIEEALKRALAEEAFHNTMFEKNIKPLGQPSFTNMLLQGNKFSCEFAVSKKPDFELGQYKDLEIPAYVPTHTVEEMTERMLEELRVQYGEMVPYGENDFVQNEDKVIVNYTGSLDGVREDNLSSDGELLTIGSTPLKEFDQNLLGMKVGETREFDILIPDTGLPSYKNKTVHFSASVSIGSKVNKLPLDNSLAAKLGKGTYEELRELVASTAARKRVEEVRTDAVSRVSALLTSSHDFIVPQFLTLSEAQYLAANSKRDWDTLSDADKETYFKLSDSNVKLALILDRIRDVEPEAQLSDQEVVDMIKDNVSKSNQNTDEVLMNMNKSGYLPVLIARLRDENTLDFILKSVKKLD